MSKKSAPVEAPEKEVELVTVSMNDLQMAYMSIEVAQKRGAYKVEEMQAVGAVATKIRTFLEQNTVKEDEGETNEASETPEA